MNRARLWALLLVGAMLTASGCGGVTGGALVAAISATTTVDAPVLSLAWDPCSIPDEAVDAAGLAVETKRKNAIGDTPISKDWDTCFWMNPLPNPWFIVGILSSTFTMDYLQKSGSFEQFTPIDGFDGLRFRRSIQYDEVSCGVAFEHSGGVVYLLLDGFVSAEPLEDPCVAIERVARSLRPSLPSSK